MINRTIYAIGKFKTSNEIKIAFGGGRGYENNPSEISSKLLKFLSHLRQGWYT